MSRRGSKIGVATEHCVVLARHAVTTLPSLKLTSLGRIPSLVWAGPQWFFSIFATALEPNMKGGGVEWSGSQKDPPWWPISGLRSRLVFAPPHSPGVTLPPAAHRLAISTDE